MSIEIDNEDQIKIDYKETDSSGFDSEVVDIKHRLINEDGNFNILRKGSLKYNLYEWFINMTWSGFFLFSFLFFFGINTFFGLCFYLLGIEYLSGIHPGPWYYEIAECIHLSVQTFTTVGYGELHPTGMASNFLASIVSFVGLMSFAIATGVFFARFSKPISHIVFSENMIISPNKDGKKSLQFRVVNASNNELIDMEARVTLAWIEKVNGNLRRKFHRLDLEVENIHLFPMNWTIVHVINDQSPLRGLSPKEMAKMGLEILILIRGYDSIYSKSVFSKRSYSCEELLENVTFAPMYDFNDHVNVLNLDNLNKMVPYTWPEK